MTDKTDQHEILMRAARSARARLCSSDDPDRAAFDLDGPVVPVDLEVVDDSALSWTVLMPDMGYPKECREDNEGPKQGE